MFQHSIYLSIKNNFWFVLYIRSKDHEAITFTWGVLFLVWQRFIAPLCMTDEQYSKLRTHTRHMVQVNSAKFRAGKRRKALVSSRIVWKTYQKSNKRMVLWATALIGKSILGREEFRLMKRFYSMCHATELVRSLGFLIYNQTPTMMLLLLLIIQKAFLCLDQRYIEHISTHHLLFTLKFCLY